jgi:transcriptional regulator with XRE-family HTH domain
MGERLKKVRIFLGLTQEQFAGKIGMTHGSLAQIENSKVSISRIPLVAFCKRFNINETWLRTGEGEMFVKTERDIRVDSIIERMCKLELYVQEYLISQAKLVDRHMLSENRKKLRKRSKKTKNGTRFGYSVFY